MELLIDGKDINYLYEIQSFIAMMAILFTDIHVVKYTGKLLWASLMQGVIQSYILIVKPSL